MNSGLRVLVADAHLPTRTGLRLLLERNGFEVAKTLITAAKRGRLGLVGMGERVRLLGGRFDVDSRPGGPTTLRLVLPRWRPVASSEPNEPELENGVQGF